MISIPQPAISVIVLNYNGKHLIGECLEALFLQSFRDFEIIVVDNGSSDGSTGFLEDTFGDRIRLIKNSQNLGFAEGNNIGFTHASGEFVALLNNDAVADSEWLSQLHSATMSSPESCGMWASKILFYENRLMIDTIGHLMYPDGLNRGQGKNEIDHGQYDMQREVFFPSGCAALYRKTMLDVIGGFDPDFFAYGDDTDIGLKARLAGWTCVLVPNAVVYHHSSATAGKYSPMKAYLVERNRLWILIKYFPFTQILLSPFHSTLRYAFQVYGALTGKGAVGRFANDRSLWVLLSVLCNAYRDAIMKFPLMIQKRKKFRKHVRVSDRQFRAWLRQYRISAREIALKD